MPEFRPAPEADVQKRLLVEPDDLRYQTLPNEIRSQVKITSTPCWQWQGSQNAYGYGRLRPRGTDIQIHRLAYELLVGPIPEDYQIDHLCRNHACLNPEHLEAVPHHVNMNRGRARKVTDEVALQILALKPSGPKRAAIGAGMGQVARQFGTSQTTVRRIWRGELIYVRSLSA